MKNIKETLVNVNKGGTFAPATAIDVLLNTDKQTNYRETKVLKNNSKKACEILNWILHLHPAKHWKVHSKIGK